MSDHHHPSGPSNYIGLLRRICPTRTLLTYTGVKQSHEMRNAMEWDYYEMQAFYSMFLKRVKCTIKCETQHFAGFGCMTALLGCGTVEML